MLKMRAKLAKFFRNESGATAIEYGLIAALVAVALIAGATLLGDGLDQAFTDISEKIVVEE
ncbi:Flp family type IVb pilin [Tabrizicola sp.]|uniref:Flp family type IVb pilin n=1 Tax=Tabrizicola sp. TaxID=2005166 RepID=UPI003D2B55D9